VRQMRRLATAVAENRPILILQITYHLGTQPSRLLITLGRTRDACVPIIFL
jgi:hypothetical protein